MRSGLFTPTEAAVVAVAYGIFVGTVVYRSIGLRDLYQVFVDSAVTSGIIMLIISLAGIFAWAGSTLGTFDAAAEALLSVSDNQWVILAMIMVFLLMAGMVLDGISIYLIMLPLLMPIVAAFQWNVTWFGVVMAMNIAIGQFTPPVAVNLDGHDGRRRRAHGKHLPLDSLADPEHDAGADRRSGLAGAGARHTQGAGVPSLDCAPRTKGRAITKKGAEASASAPFPCSRDHHAAARSSPLTARSSRVTDSFTPYSAKNDPMRGPWSCPSNTW